MERFIHRQNLERYRDLLARITDEAQRQQILKLIAEEEAKDSSSPSKQTKRPPQLAASFVFRAPMTGVASREARRPQQPL